jgi:hypothetical protein
MERIDRCRVDLQLVAAPARHDRRAVAVGQQATQL